MAQGNAMATYQTQQSYVDTVGLGGDRFGFMPTGMFSPTSFVGTTSPVPLALLSAPPTYGQLDSINQAPWYGGSPAASNASQQPWSPTQSPLPLIIVALIVGWYGIHHMYYKKGK